MELSGQKWTDVASSNLAVCIARWVEWFQDRTQSWMEEQGQLVLFLLAQLHDNDVRGDKNKDEVQPQFASEPQLQERNGGKEILDPSQLIFCDPRVWLNMVARWCWPRWVFGLIHQDFP